MYGNTIKIYIVLYNKYMINTSIECAYTKMFGLSVLGWWNTSCGWPRRGRLSVFIISFIYFITTRCNGGKEESLERWNEQTHESPPPNFSKSMNHKKKICLIHVHTMYTDVKCKDLLTLYIINVVHLNNIMMRKWPDHKNMYFNKETVVLVITM